MAGSHIPLKCMAIEQKLIHCEPDDPNRCQGVTRAGQCMFLSEEGSKFCLRHGANKAHEAARKKSLNLYRLQLWQQRLDEFAESSEATNLKSEIGILRMTLESLLNKCQSSTDLILYSNKISDLTVKIEKLIASSHRIERSLGNLLDRTAALNFAERVIAVVSAHVTDTEVIDAISSGIIDALKEATSGTSE